MVSEASPADTFVETPASIDDFALGALMGQLPQLGEAKEHQGSGEIQPLSLLGMGGMGRVDVAYQASLKREVAVKSVREEKRNAKTTRLLLHEGFVSGHLEHPNIVPVHMMGKGQGDQPELVMRRVEGVSWEELLDTPEHPIWQRRKSWSNDIQVWHLEILMEICQVVDYAHSRGFVHRDIKPENVMIGAFGEVYLLDWGLAAPLPGQAQDAASLPSFPAPAGGTPAYMAPEMVQGKLEVIDARTDVFLLGATLHRILTGQARHPGLSVQEAFFSAAICEPVDYHSKVPRELAEIANKAMHRDPAMRFQSAWALRTALADYLQHLPSLALTRSASQRLQQLIHLSQHDDGSAPSLPQIIRRLFNECRFGFLQALEGWEHNPVALQGLEQALEAMLHYELAQQNLDNAVALLGELKRPPPQLSEAVDQLHQQLQKEQAEHERMKQLAFEFDISIGHHKRIRLFAIMGALIGVMALALLVTIRLGWITLDYTKLLGTMVVGMGGLGGFVWLWRVQLLENRIGRQFMIILSIIMLSMTLNRLASLKFGIPLTHALQTEFLLFAALMAASSQLFLKRLLWGVPILFVAFLVALFVPTLTFEIYVAVTFFMWFFPTYAFWQQFRRKTIT